MLYGFRVVRALIIGLILGGVAAWFLWRPLFRDYPTKFSGAESNLVSVSLIVVPLLVYLGVQMLRAAGSVHLGLRTTRNELLRSTDFREGSGCLWMIVKGGAFFGAFMVCLVIWSAWGDAPPMSSTSTKEDSRDELRTVLIVALKALTPIAFFCLPLFLVWQLQMVKNADWYIRWFKQHRGGSARWAGPETYRKLIAQWGKKTEEGRTLSGVFIGRTMFADNFLKSDVVFKDDGHMLTIAQPGSGKSITAIWPNLATYKGSMIVVDPKGEHTDAFLGRRQDPSRFYTLDQEKNYQNEVEQRIKDGTARGSDAGWLDCHLRSYRCAGTDTRKKSKARFTLKDGQAFALDPFGQNKRGYSSATYNPLCEIDVTSINARKIISAISTACVPPGQGENKFWVDAARMMIEGTIAYVLATEPKEKHNLPYVADLLIGVDPATGFADPQKFWELVAKMRTSDAAGGLPRLAAATLDDLGEKAFGGVTAELRLGLKWVTDEAMRTHLSGESSFWFQSLGQTLRYTVFIVIPFGHMVEQMRWLRTLIQVSATILEDRSPDWREDEAKDPDTSGRVLYILDELPQYGAHLNIVKEGLVRLRGAGVKLWAFVQFHHQLVECFGVEGAKAFQAGGTVQVFGVGDDGTAAFVSKKLGEHRIQDTTGVVMREVVGERQESLVPAAAVEADLRQRAPVQYVFSSHGPPMRLKRVAFRKMKVLDQAFDGLPLEGHYDE